MKELENTYLEVNRAQLLKLISEATTVKLFVANSHAKDLKEDIAFGELNDFVFRHEDGTLEFWVNTDYEI